MRNFGGRRGALEQLRPLWALDGCTDRDLGRVESLTSEVHPWPGQVLLKEGDDASGFFLVLTGHAVATVGDVELGLLGPGAFYGETALLDDGHEPVTVTACTAMLVRGAAPAAFEELLLIRPLTHRLLETLASRQRLALGTARAEYRRRGDVSGLTLGAPSGG